MTDYQTNAAIVLAIVYVFVTMAGALLAFRRNRLRPDDDPKKQKYSLTYIFLAPFTIPLITPIIIILLTVFSILFGAFLVVFTLVMLIFRQVTLLKELIEIWVKIGDALLKIARILLWPLYYILSQLFRAGQIP